MNHVGYDKESGHFVPGGRKKPTKVQVTVKVDEKNLNILRDMPQAPKRQRGSMCQTRGCMCTVHVHMRRKLVGDTGAGVCCSGTDMIEKLGIRKQDLLTTELALIAAQ